MALEEEKAWERARMEEEEAAAAADAASRAAMELKAGVTRRLELQTQMAAKAHMRAAEHDDKLREAEMTQVGSDQQAGGVAMRHGCNGAAVALVGSPTVTIAAVMVQSAIQGYVSLQVANGFSITRCPVSIGALRCGVCCAVRIRVFLDSRSTSLQWPRAGGGAGLPQQGGRDAAENRSARVARAAQVRLVRAPLEQRHLHGSGLQYERELMSRR